MFHSQDNGNRQISEPNLTSGFHKPWSYQYKKYLGVVDRQPLASDPLSGR